MTVRIHRRQIIAALCSLALPLAVVAASGAQVRRGASSAGPYVQPKPSLFGLNTGTFDNVYNDYLTDFSRARTIGARWIHITGHSIHWTNGQVDFSALDHGVDLAKQQGLGLMLSLGGDPNPAACSTTPPPPDPTNCPPKTASDFRYYTSFLRDELLRYRNVVTYYESWVEPNHAGRWPPFPDPTQYAALLQAQYGVFQSVNREYGLHLKLLFGGPNDFSIAPGSSSGMPALPFAHQVLVALQGQKAFDGIALHPYRFPPATRPPDYASWDNVQGIPAASGLNGPYPNCTWVGGLNGAHTWCMMTWPQELQAYEQEFADMGYPNEPLWLSEFGWPGSSSVPANPQPSADFYPSYQAQKADLEYAYQTLLGLPFVQAAFWFNLRDYTPGIPNPDPPFFAHYGLATYKGVYKPAAAAFTALAQANPGR